MAPEREFPSIKPRVIARWGAAGSEYTLVGKPTTRMNQRNHITGKLEVDPGGQFGFLEDETGVPLTATLADLLARGAP